MHSILRSIRNPVLPGMMALALLQASHAVVIKVTATPETADRQTMKDAAAQLRESWEAAEPGNRQASGQINGFSFEVAEGPIVPRTFSMIPGTVAYLWSDHTFRFEQGFRFQGNRSMMFDKKAEPNSPQAKQSAEPILPIWETGFRGTSVKGDLLRLDYSLKQGGLVTVEIMGTNGKVLERWSWQDGVPGHHTKTLKTNRLAGNGVVFMRWSHGKHTVTRRIATIK